MMNPDILIVVHCYQGDRQQVLDFLPLYQHHQAPIVIVSPTDSQVHEIGPHHTRCAGKRAYIGQESWDRQFQQLKLLLEYPQTWFLLNDADSFVLTPKIADYLFEDENTLRGNLVNDFRIPGKTWTDKNGSYTWPTTFHQGHELIAIQPPYFCHRKVLEKIVATCENLEACPITPFIDWWWVVATDTAKVTHKPFRDGVSCETMTPNGRAIVSRLVREGANMVHSVKSVEAMELMLQAYKERA